jgi:isopropylmalate/homocitrate/citramalate synthase
MPLEMFPFLPETVGHGPVRIVLGKKSGKDSILYKAKELNIAVDLERADAILMSVKSEAINKKRNLSDEEFVDIVKRVQ